MWNNDLSVHYIGRMLDLTPKAIYSLVRRLRDKHTMKFRCRRSKCFKARGSND